MLSYSSLCHPAVRLHFIIKVDILWSLYATKKADLTRQRLVHSRTICPVLVWPKLLSFLNHSGRSNIQFCNQIKLVHGLHTFIFTYVTKGSHKQTVGLFPTFSEPLHPSLPYALLVSLFFFSFHGDIESIWAIGKRGGGGRLTSTLRRVMELPCVYW